MPIGINYQPSAGSVGNAAFAKGRENLRRYENQEAVRQQEIAQRDRMQIRGIEDTQARQAQQLDFNAKSQALGIYANQETQKRSFNQQSKIQDDAQESAAALQDQRIQQAYDQQRASIADAQYRQQLALQADFAKQFVNNQNQEDRDYRLAGLNQQARNIGFAQSQYANQLEAGYKQQQAQQAAALNQKQLEQVAKNNEAKAQQKIDFSKFEMNAQQEQQVQQLQANRSRLEQLKATGAINDQQYSEANAQLLARELGLEKSLTPVKNPDLLEEFNKKVLPVGGQKFQVMPDGSFELLAEPKQENNQRFELEQKKFEFEQEQEKIKGIQDWQKEVATLGTNIYKAQLASANADSADPVKAMEKAQQMMPNPYGPSPAQQPAPAPNAAGMSYEQNLQVQGLPPSPPSGGQWLFPGEVGMPQAKDSKDSMILKPGTKYYTPQGIPVVR